MKKARTPKTDFVLKYARDRAAEGDCILEAVEEALMSMEHKLLLGVAAENMEIMLEPDYPYDEGMAQDCLLDLIESRLRVCLKRKVGESNAIQ